MTEEEFSALLQKARSAVGNFNQLTDTLNETIREFEHLLLEMGVGMRVDLNDSERYELASVGVDDFDRFGDRDVREVKYLSFRRAWPRGEVNERWGLFVVSALEEYEGGEFSRSLGDDPCSDNRPLPLIESPREIRIKAVPLFADLLRAITRRAEESATRVLDAQRLVAGMRGEQ